MVSIFSQSWCDSMYSALMGREGKTNRFDRLSDADHAINFDLKNVTQDQSDILF